jgi:hypothetical protein
MSGMGGCGGGCGGQGGCGSAVGTSTVRDGAFARPSFFAGQLLTEDDLGALAEYVKAKDRLHNRYLVGSGVVCGLHVACSPADPGSVLVCAGYALDCCGNDIVVPCDQTVDVVELLADLPRNAGCADPCTPPTKKKEQKAEKTEQADRNGTDEDSQPLPRRYQLVVEYAETLTELVAPYTAGEDGARACQPTRVREGYRFALRCVPDKPRRPPSLIDAVEACTELDGQAKDRLGRLRAAVETARGLALAITDQVEAAPPLEEVAEARERLAASPDLPQAIRLAGMGVRLAAQREQDEATLTLAAVRDALTRVQPQVGDDPLRSAQAAALAQQVEGLATRLGSFQATRPDRQLAKGVVAGQAVRDSLRSMLADARDWALGRLEQHPSGHCRSMEQLERLTFPGPGDDAGLQRVAKVVEAAVEEVTRDCICGAVNPPCVPCEDEAVVLAEITLEDCEVVEVCDLVRRHAVTGTALRYWLPLEWLYEQVEAACCEGADPRELLGPLRRLVRAFLAGDWEPQHQAVAGRAPHAPGAEPANEVAAGPAVLPAAQPAAPTEPEALNEGERRLLKMLNSQVQTMQAQLRKLQAAVDQGGAGG